MPSKEYFATTAISFHSLRDFGREGPGYYYRKHILRCEPWRSSAAMELGTAIHMAILEPHLFGDQYAVLPDEYTTPSGAPSQSKAAKAWRAENSEKDFLSRNQWSTVMACRDAVLDHEPAKKLLDESPLREVEKYGIVFDMPAKGCADAVGQRIVDLKTIADIALVRQHIERFDYRHQLAWYTRLFEKRQPGRLIFVETQAPHRVMVVEPHWREEARAWSEIVDWCDTLKRCQAEDLWDLATDYDILQRRMREDVCHPGVAVI